MYKEARKKAIDPNQEKLRQSKQDWNAEVSEFIKTLIEFKKLMNGRENQFFKQKTKITDPIPSDPVAIVSSLASNFADLAVKGKNLVEEQSVYSKSRMQNFQQTHHANDGLMSEATNPLSRMISRFKGPILFGPEEEKRKNKYRINFLNTMTVILKDLSSLEDIILDVDYKNVHQANSIVNSIIIKLQAAKKFINTFAPMKEELSHKPEETLNVNKQDQPSEEKKPEDANLPLSARYNKISSDYLLHHKNVPSTELKNPMLQSLYLKKTRELNSAIEKISVSSTINARILDEVYQGAIERYEVLLDLCSRDMLKPGQEKFRSFEEVKRFLHGSPKIASNAISKYFKRLRHKIHPFDQTSAIRLDLSEMVSNLKKEVGIIVDELEEDFEPEKLSDQIATVIEQARMLDDLVSALTDAAYVDKFYTPFMTNVKDPNRYSDKELENLEKQMRRTTLLDSIKRLRNISDKKK